MTPQRLWWAAAVLFVLGPGTVGAADVRLEPVPKTPVAADLERGKRLYTTYCAQCHGEKGDGKGPAAEFVYPRPRDFTLALFKVRSTLSGQLPTDHDLFHVISKSLPGTSMPAWEKYLSEDDRWQLVHYVKTFDSLGIFKDEPPKERLAVGAPPKVTPELVAKGKELYQQKKCWQCHGSGGRGDGPSAAGMKDDWGFPIRPVNFTKSWRFRGGDRIEDIYRTFTTGFNGTPMPSFADSIKEDDRWALAAYVKSLTRPTQSGQVLRARRIEGEIPADPYAAAWEQAEYLDVPLAGQIIVKPRWFKPAHDVVTAAALYNDKEVALLLVWDDGTHNVGRGGKPAETATTPSLARGPRLDPIADRAGVQWPAQKDRGEKPYFLLGDRKHPVDLWRWDAAKGLERATARGHEQVQARPVGQVAAQGGYRDGQYRVIFRRPRVGADEIEFEPGRFVPLAFQLWDGANDESGLKMALSSWYYLLLVPPTPVTAYLWPVLLGVAAFGGELWLRRRLRKGRKA